MRVLTMGSFDMFHVGHARLINKCLRLGHTTIGLNTDKFYEKYRGYKPIMSYLERYEILSELYPLVDILPNDQENGTAKSLIIESQAELIVCGSDWHGRDYLKQIGVDWQWLEDANVGICYFNYSSDISSTEIKNRIKNA